MIEPIQIRLKHFAKDGVIKTESTPCIQHTMMFAIGEQLKSPHAKLEFKNKIRSFIDDLFTEDFFLYEVEIEGKQMVVVTIVDIRSKMDIETGKEMIKK